MLCICLDAFKPEYYKYAPYLNSLRKENLSGELETVLAYTGIGATFFTGLYPDTHGIFAMFSYTPQDPMTRFPFLGKRIAGTLANLGKYLKNERFFFRMHHIPGRFLRSFNVTQKKALPQRNCLKVKTLFDTLEENNKTFSYVDYPNHFLGRRGSLFFSHSNSAVLKKMTEKKTDISFAHFLGIDCVSHRFGTKSRETRECVKELDEVMGNLDNERMLIWSDHGMLDVRGEINIQERLQETSLRAGRDYSYFLDTTMARFWFRNERARETIKGLLGELKNGHILTEKETTLFRMPDGYGNLIFLTDPGFIILPNFFQGSHPIKAAHGYDPGAPGQKGIYIVTGARGKRNARMVDMMPTILDIMHLPIPACDGKTLLR